MNPQDILKKSSVEIADLLTGEQLNLDLKNSELQTLNLKAKVDAYNKGKDIARTEANIALLSAPQVLPTPVQILKA